jgi:hypothetical protein
MIQIILRNKILRMQKKVIFQYKACIETLGRYKKY